MSVTGLSSCLFLEQRKPHSSDDSLFGDSFSRPALVFMMFPPLRFLTIAVVPGKLPGPGQILYVLQNMPVKDIKSGFFTNDAAVKHFISLDLEKVKTNLTSECILQACFPSMCSSGCFILLFSWWFILIKLHSLSDSLPVKHLREIIWWWSWDHLEGRGIAGTWALEQG